MSLTRINEFLSVLAMLNNGADHASDYHMVHLPKATSLEDALASYYSGLKTSLKGPFPAEYWHIESHSLSDWRSTLSERARHWFFEEFYSPKVDRDWVKDDVVNNFLMMIERDLGDTKVYKIQTAPPIWYGNMWDEFAFEGKEVFSLLHFSHSD